MAILVFDIETSALPVDQFDEAQQEYLFRDAARLADPGEQEARRAEIRQQFNLWPLTAQVLCVAMLNVESGRGQVHYLAEDAGEASDVTGEVKFVPCAEESELLAGFWDAARRR